MGVLVDDSVGLVLAVASAGQGDHVVEEVGAVGLVAGAGQGVGDDTVGAGTVDVGAVEAGDTAGAGATLADDAGEDGGDRVAGGSGGRLEVLSHPGGRAGGGGGLSRAGKAGAVGQGGADGGKAAASAVALDNAALLMEGNAGGSSLRAFDLGLQLVGVERNGAGEDSAVSLGEGESTVRLNVELATGGKVVHLGNIEGDLYRFTSTNVLESLLREVLGVHAKTKTIELESLSYCNCQ